MERSERTRRRDTGDNATGSVRPVRLARSARPCAFWRARRRPRRICCGCASPRSRRTARGSPFASRVRYGSRRRPAATRWRSRPPAFMPPRRCGRHQAISIAFATDRFGAINIFIAPAAGGEAERAHTDFLRSAAFELHFGRQGCPLLVATARRRRPDFRDPQPIRGVEPALRSPGRGRPRAAGLAQRRAATRDGICRSDVCFTP